MSTQPTIHRREVLKVSTGGALAAGTFAGAALTRAESAAAAVSAERAAGTREIVAGIKTNRLIPGEPYELAGKRMVFTNWYYVRPGDLDWVDDDEKSVYVDGNEDLWTAQFRGVDTPRGIRITANRPQLGEPLDMPIHRGIIQQEGSFLGWSDNVSYESDNAFDWKLRGNCKFHGQIKEGVQSVFIDPSAPPAERFKMCWPSSFSIEEFEEFRRKRPDSLCPR